MKLDHAVVARHSQRPAWAAPREPRDQSRALRIHLIGVQQPLDVGCRDRVEEHPLAARNHSGQHDERVEARRGEDDHAVRMRLLESFQKNALVLVAQPADVGHQRDAAGPDRRLEVEEGLQRELVEFRRFVGQQPDLVDGKGLDPIVLPIVGVAVQGSLGQQRCRQRTRCCGLTEAGLADEKVCVGKPPGTELRAQLVEGLDVPNNCSERIKAEPNLPPPFRGAINRAHPQRRFARRAGGEGL